MGELKIFLSIILIAISLSSILLIRNFQPKISETGYFVIITGSSLGLISGFIITLSLILQVFGKKPAVEEKKELPKGALEECEKMLYKIEEIDTSKLNDMNKVKYMVKGVLPSLNHFIKSYKEFIHRLPQNYRTSLYSMLYSLTGKHGHYEPRRMLHDFKNLRETLMGIVQIYKTSV